MTITNGTKSALSIAAKIGAGTTIFILIVILASRMPAASGLMLTFPALNGLAYAYAINHEIDSKTSSMLWMPALNALLCGAFILLFIKCPSIFGTFRPAVVMLIVIFIIWLAIARQLLKSFKITSGHRPLFAGVATLCCLVAAMIVWSPMAPVTTQVANAPPSWDALTAFSSHQVKIALFAVLLTLYVIACDFWKIEAKWKGVFAGLPLVPFFGLFSIAQDDAIPLDARLAILMQMATGLCLAPAIAIWFIYGVSSRLVKQIHSGKEPDLTHRYAVVMTGWLLCGLVIKGLSMILTASSAA